MGSSPLPLGGSVARRLQNWIVSAVQTPMAFHGRGIAEAIAIGVEFEVALVPGEAKQALFDRLIPNRDSKPPYSTQE
ncbi:hypothetical protein R1flu_006856 [Riccia fluitans]|uniref:Uncharacterized protein n=1 Tax=Riccia fluitans TaxID=41844 RepID=A0ABD1Z1B4_9MARC